MIAPHGSDELRPLYVREAWRRAELLREAQTLPSVTLTSGAAADAVMMGAGYFTPLPGFMSRKDALAVGERMRTASGLFWPVPVLNRVPDEAPLGRANRIALRDPNLEGCPVIAIQDIEAVERFTEAELGLLTRQIFRTDDPRHPGVAAFTSAGRSCIAGPIAVLHFSYFERDFPETFRRADQIRAAIARLGWRRVVAFQTRNPMHRAHEELCRMAQAAVQADGILIHMLLGKLQPADLPAAVRDAAIRTMVELYFPKDSVLVAGYGFDMLYAGPREAVLHALFRQNCGCTHFIVGRDHAGVGGYYGEFDAQAIFGQEVPPGALQIEIFEADHVAWSKKLQRLVMMREAQDHRPEDYLVLSGARVREMLAAGEPLPPELVRPEVAEILRAYYRARTEEERGR